jgi:hypothetical protein
MSDGRVDVFGNAWAAQPVTANAPLDSFTPTADQVEYAWYAGDSKNHDPEPLAEGPEFVIPDNAVVGAQYTVVATATVDGYQPRQVTNTGTITTGTIGAGQADITGTAWPGTMATAVADTTSFTPPVTDITYQWYATGDEDGEPLAETAEFLIPANSNPGDRYTVIATGIRFGYTPKTVPAYLEIQTGTITEGTTEISGHPWAGQTLTASTINYDPPTTQFTYLWYQGDTPTGEPLTDTPTYTIPDTVQPGTQYTIQTTGTLPGYNPIQHTQQITITTGTMTGGTITITGNPWPGETLTATAAPGSWTPAATAVDYVWYAGTGPDPESGPSGSEPADPDNPADDSQPDDTDNPSGGTPDDSDNPAPDSQLDQLQNLAADGPQIAGRGATFTIPTGTTPGEQFTVQATASRQGFTPATAAATRAIIARPAPGGTPGGSGGGQPGDGPADGSGGSGIGGAGGAIPEPPDGADPAGIGRPAPAPVKTVLTATLVKSSVKAGKKPVVLIAVGVPGGPTPTGKVVISYKIGNKTGKTTVTLVGGKARVRLPVALNKKNAGFKITATYQGGRTVKSAEAAARLLPTVTAEASRTAVDVTVGSYGVVKPTGKVKVKVVNVITGQVMLTKTVKLKPTADPAKATARVAINPRLGHGTYKATVTYRGNTQTAPLDGKKAWKRVFHVYRH